MKILKSIKHTFNTIRQIHRNIIDDLKSFYYPEIVIAVIRNKDNEYLLCQRSSNDTMPLSWELPGGKREIGESKKEALIREIKEELDIDITIIKKIVRVRHSYSFGNYKLIAYEASILQGTPKKIVHEEIKWVGEADLNSLNLCPPDRSVLKIHKKTQNSKLKEKANGTLNLFIADLIINCYYISIVWLLKKLLSRFIKPNNMFFQNLTDIYILLRLILPSCFIYFGIKNITATIFCVYLIFEMVIAHLSHFLSNKFNASGSGKVTAVRRTVIIIFINFFTFVLLFAYFYSLVLNYSRFDLFYYSIINITSPLFDISLPFKQKLIITIEGITGVFYVGYIIATIIGWSKTREEIEK